MPNGVSCAFFAFKNLENGYCNKDVFREGIAACQAIRTVDAVVNSSLNIKSVLPASETANAFIGNAAKIAKKIVYPLIIASGVYNTATADDKVKTGAKQAAGIATMYSFETIAEKTLKNLAKKLIESPFVKQHKSAKYAIYILKGLSFVAASLAGYDLGSNGAEKIVDKIRAKKNHNANVKQNNENTSDEVDNVLNEFVFSDMKL